MGRAVTHEPIPSALTHSSSFLPSLPSSNSVQQPTNRQQSPIFDKSRPHKVHPHGQLVSGGARSMQKASRQPQQPYSSTPIPQQGPSTSRSVLKVGSGSTPAHFNTSAFTFRVPSQTNYRVPQVSQGHPNRHRVSTGYPSHSRDPTVEAITRPSTQTSDQMNVAPPRSGTWHSIVAVGRIFIAT